MILDDHNQSAPSPRATPTPAAGDAAGAADDHVHGVGPGLAACDWDTGGAPAGSMSGASPLAGDPAIETGNGAALNGSGCVAGGRPIPPKLYRIGEVVEYSGYSRQTIHNYTIIGLLRESRWTKGGHRLYDESVFARLDLIAQLKAQGVPLQEIRQRVCGTEAAGVM